MPAAHAPSRAGRIPGHKSLPLHLQRDRCPVRVSDIQGASMAKDGCQESAEETSYPAGFLGACSSTDGPLLCPLHLPLQAIAGSRSFPLLYLMGPVGLLQTAVEICEICQCAQGWVAEPQVSSAGLPQGGFQRGPIRAGFSGPSAACRLPSRIGFQPRRRWSIRSAIHAAMPSHLKRVVRSRLCRVNPFLVPLSTGLKSGEYGLN
jgi:hypothetical protein